MNSIGWLIDSFWIDSSSMYSLFFFVKKISFPPTYPPNTNSSACTASTHRFSFLPSFIFISFPTYPPPTSVPAPLLPIVLPSFIYTSFFILCLF